MKEHTSHPLFELVDRNGPSLDCSCWYTILFWQDDPRDKIEVTVKEFVKTIINKSSKDTRYDIFVYDKHNNGIVKYVIIDGKIDNDNIIDEYIDIYANNVANIGSGFEMYKIHTL